MLVPEHIDPRRAALIAYDVCRRALTPSDPARKAAMRPVLDAWVHMIAAARAAGVPVIYTTPGQPRQWRRRGHAADRPLGGDRRAAADQRGRGHAGAGFPDEIAPRPEDYVFLKRRPSAFYGTGIAELLHMLRRDTIIIGGGATNRGVETSVREAFNLDLAAVVVRECCWGGDTAAHAYSLDKAMKMYARIRRLDQVVAMLAG